jgi:Protein of unknown function (DUF2752)
MGPTSTAAATRGPTPARPPARGPGLRAALVTGGVALAGTVVVHLYDPHEPGSYGLCPLRMATGLLCPFCGGTRAVHAMTHGDWGQALGLNPLLTLLAPVALVAWLVWVVRAVRGRHTPFLDRVGAVWALILAIVAFGVLRNLPALAPHLARLT